MSLPDLNNKLINNPVFLAQGWHFGIPYGALLTLDHRHSPWFYPLAAGFVVFAGFKEFWYDANYENPKQSFGKNLLDFSFYMLGIAAAIFVHRH